MIRSDNFYGDRVRNGLKAAQSYPSRSAAARALSIHRCTLLRWEAKAEQPVVPSTERLVAHHRKSIVEELAWLRIEKRVLEALLASERQRQERQRPAKAKWSSNSDTFP